MESNESIQLTAEQANTLRTECNRLIDLANCMERLKTNPDFQKIFTEAYEKEEAIRLVKLLGEPSFNTNANRDSLRNDLKERMIGIARFSEYVRSLYSRADMASKQLADLEEAERESNIQ